MENVQQGEVQPGLGRDLLQLNAVSPRVAEKRLPVDPNALRVADFQSLGAELGHAGIKVADLDGEVVKRFGAGFADDKVYLLCADVEPPASERKIRAITPNHETDDVDVERPGFVSVFDGQVDMMNSENLHTGSVRLAGPVPHSCGRCRFALTGSTTRLRTADDRSSPSRHQQIVA